MSTKILALDGPPESVARAIAELRSTIEYENLAVTVTEPDARLIAAARGEPMMTKPTIGHTPGPWAVKEYDNGFTGEYGLHGIFAAGAVTPLVPSVWGSTLAESDANARLIAATPELRDLLERYRRATSRTGQTAVLVDKAALDAADADADALLARIDGSEG